MTRHYPEICRVRVHCTRTRTRTGIYSLLDNSTICSNKFRNKYLFKIFLRNTATVFTYLECFTLLEKLKSKNF